jgi:threonylcarbamoyladenosine tRNA methylthiotransferase MtaB
LAKVHLTALGCRLNEAELAQWSRTFRDQGHQLTGSPDGADLIVINTCAVTQAAARKSRQLMRRLQRQYPNARLVVTGCYTSLEKNQPDIADLLISNQEKAQLVNLTETRFSLPIAAPSIPLKQSSDQHTRAFIKVQDGCRHRCSYCIVTLARGEERSRPLREILDEVNQLHSEGVQEIVLTGVHLGGYGSDLGHRLQDLMAALLADTDVPRLRLGSLEPWDVPDQLWTLMQSPRCMPHLHLPLQSGCDSVLQRMARRGRCADFRRLVETARSHIRDINITTDIIVGFPGESESEWQQNLDFIRRIGFGDLHLFPYSQRQGTKAASLPQQVNETIKQARLRELKLLAQEQRKAFLEAQIGRSLAVLIERRDAPDHPWSGYSPNYVRVDIDNPPVEGNLRNRIIEVTIKAYQDGKLRGLIPLAD